MRAKIVATVIVAFWLVMMGSLVRRYLPGGAGRSDAPPLDTATLADAWRDSEEWMELRWNQMPVGVMRTTARRLAPSADSLSTSAAVAHPGAAEMNSSAAGAEAASNNAVTNDPADAGVAEPAAAVPTSEIPANNPSPQKDRFQVVVLIGLGLGPFQARASTSALLNERLILDQFSLRLEIGPPGGSGDRNLRLDGVARGTTLSVRIESGGARQYRAVKLARPVSLAEGLSSLYSRSDLKVGDTYTLPVFDPIWNMQGGSMTVHVAAEEKLRVDNRDVDVLRVETTMANAKTTTWVDRDGRVWKRDVPPLAMTALDPDAAVRRHPWMADLPVPPHLTLADMQGEDRGDPLGSTGILGLLRGAMDEKPSDSTHE